jgi:hypothetical protein
MTGKPQVETTKAGRPEFQPRGLERAPSPPYRNSAFPVLDMWITGAPASAARSRRWHASCVESRQSGIGCGFPSFPSQKRTLLISIEESTHCTTFGELTAGIAARTFSMTANEIPAGWSSFNSEEVGAEA